MKKQKMLAFALAVTLMGLVPTVSLGAQDSEQRGRPQGPPPEAIKACEGKEVGAEVSFKDPRGETHEGRCQEHDGQLAAMPKRGPA